MEWNFSLEQFQQSETKDALLYPSEYRYSCYSVCPILVGESQEQYVKGTQSFLTQQKVYISSATRQGQKCSIWLENIWTRSVNVIKVVLGSQCHFNPSILNAASVRWISLSVVVYNLHSMIYIPTAVASCSFWRDLSVSLLTVKALWKACGCDLALHKWKVIYWLIECDEKRNEGLWCNSCKYWLRT